MEKEKLFRSRLIIHIPNNTIRTKATSKTLNTTETSCQASFFDFFSRYSVKTGTKEPVNAPSPNRRRSKLGIIKAIKKASHTRLAPNRLALKISRKSPRIRLRKVDELIIPNDFASALSFDISKDYRPNNKNKSLNLNRLTNYPLTITIGVLTDD